MSFGPKAPARPHPHAFPSILRVRAALVLSLFMPAALVAQAGDSTKAQADTALQVERILITAIRASNLAPVSQTTVERSVLAARQFGQDVPLLLANAAPALTAHTETGTNWGYSYLRLRGIDQTRINITLDGVPLNDMEDQVLYFANFADMMSGVQSVQIQRGVGTSTAGTASFAGSINFESMPLARLESGGDLQLQFGSYGAQRVSGAYRASVNDRFAVQVRGGALRTNGYRDHSGVAGGSALVGAGWFGDRNIVKLTAMLGELWDTLSYVGATVAELRQNRRFNPLSPDERDHFGQQMLALSVTRLASPSTSFSTTLYRNSAGGNYDYFAGDDKYRYNLEHAWYGTTGALNSTRGRWQFSLGVNANTYERAHRAWLRPDPAALYRNVGHKDDVSAFAKASYDDGRVHWFADVQARHARFRYQPDPFAGVSGRATSWAFFNPKGGVTVRLGTGLSAYASYGAATREPARSDLFAGDDDMNRGNVDAIGDLSRVRPESVRDAELGVTLSRPALELQANVYRMDFRNSIERIGAPTASGLIPRRNVGAAFRHGIEFDATWRPVPRLSLGANAWLSRNRIEAFDDSTVDPVVVRRNVPPMLTPSVMTVHRAELTLAPFLALGVEGRYQGRSHLDNTGDAARVLPAVYVLDGSARLTAWRYSLVLRGTNLGDSQGYASGSVSSSGTVRYFVLPGRSLFITAGVRF